MVQLKPDFLQKIKAMSNEFVQGGLDDDEIKLILEALELSESVYQRIDELKQKNKQLEAKIKELEEKEIELTEWTANLIRSGEKNKETIQKVREEIKELKENSDKWIKYLSESPTGTLKIILNLESQVKELTEEILKEKK